MLQFFQLGTHVGTVCPDRLRRWLQGSVSGSRRALVAFTVATGLFAGMCGVGSSCLGAEPAKAFLRELRARGYHDLAAHYLDQLDSSATIDDAFRKRLDFEQGEVLIQAAIGQRSVDQKQEYLDRAQAKFEKFVTENPDHALALAAGGRLGTILIERARLLLSEADKASVGTAERRDLQAKARQLFADAAQVFVENKAALRKRLEAMPKTLSADKDRDLIEERDQLRADYVEAQFVAAMVLYEQALSFDAGSSDRSARMKEAETAFGSVADKYRRRLAGLSAVLFQARCQQELGEYRKALSFFEDLLTLPDSEAVLRPIKTKALRGAMECWLEPSVNQLEAARQRAESWLDQQRPNERSDDDWLVVKLRLAQTYQRLAAAQDAGRDRAAFERDARRFAADVAKYRSSWQDEAQQLLADLGQPTQTLPANVKVESFAEAIAAAREALSQRQVAAHTIDLLQGRLAQAAEASARAEMEQALSDAEAQRDQAEQNAFALLQQARSMMTDETPIEQVNQVRYYLGTLYFYREDYFSAAVMCEFLSARYPATEEGRRAAAVALASLVRLYGDGTMPSAPALRQRMIKTAERIARQWKGESEADDALATLVSLAVQEGDTAQAMRYLEQMSDASPKRGVAALAAGQSLWNSANRALAAGADPSQIEQQQSQAADLMTRGLQQGAASPPSATGIAATLLVAQYQLSHDQAQQAIELLDAPEVGPHSLVKQQHPLMRRPGLEMQTLRLAILAYVAALPDADNAAALLDQALDTLEQMKSVASRGENDDQQLASTYVMLARSLEEQIKTAPAARRQMLVRAFEQFLDRAAASSQELNVLSWVAQSYLTLGKAMRESEGQVSTTAQGYFDKALQSYQQILARSDRNEFTMTQQERLLMETRVAMAYREAGQYAAAIEQFAKILARDNSQIYVQLEAARTFEDWGNQGGKSAYEKAIAGDTPDPKTGRNQIWGYGRIAKLVAGKQQFEELFHDARYHLARCRFQHAINLAASERKAVLEQAERDVVMTAKLYPSLGGEPRKSQYASLLEQIQRTLGKPSTGLP